jgi:hypothetical protein
MRELRYTLVSDGSSDRALMPILNWILRQYTVGCALQPAWADLRRVPHPVRDLTTRIQWGLDLYPCDVLFVHRDAERMQYTRRVQEIEHALSVLDTRMQQPAICVVPVRMTEAWLLFDEAAMRRAAGNPNGRQSLQFPSLLQLEQLPNPKRVLHDLLRRASGRAGRRLKNFRVDVHVHMVAEYTSDFSPLRDLPAFAALERAIEEALAMHGRGEAR